MIRIITMNSVYEINADKKSVTRYPSDSAGQLRKDMEEIPIISIDPVILGQPMTLQLTIVDGVITFRRTSAVQAIEEIVDEEPRKEDLSGSEEVEQEGQLDPDPAHLDG